MPPPNWDRVQEIYHAALALPRSERSAYIANACGDDADLLREVNSLIEADDSSSDFLDTPVMKLPSAPDDLVGTTIGDRYYLERELGPGGMAQVYLARDLKLNQRMVVIKVLSQALANVSYARQRFKKEAEALSRFRHEGIVNVLDIGDLPDGRPYIVMEYVDGEMLRSHIPPEGLDLKRAASILKQIGAALDHVHEHGIFHRDLKPENILLKRGTDSIVLIDFGIAKVTDSAVVPTTTAGTAAGTLVYMSPEQLRGEEIIAATDIYSMAVIAYEMVTGRRPFTPSSPSHLLDMQRAGVRIKPGGLRPDLSFKAEQIILKGLSFKPNARYKRAGEFGNDLANALRTHEKAVTNRWPIAIAALVVLITAAALFAFYKYRKKTPDPGPTHAFTYQLTIQRMRDGKEYQDPEKSNGLDTFYGGDKYRLSVSTTEPAYLYLFNEGSPEPNDTNFTMVYPRLATNNGSATVGANQSIQSDWMTFRGPAGDENFWMVWSVSPVNQLEYAKIEAFKHPRGGLTGDTLVAVKEFLRTKQAETKVRVTHYKATQTVSVRGPGDLLITLAQFKHL